MFSLKGKNAIVTGGGSGIGLSICKIFAKQGAHVGILDINTEAAEKTASEIKENGGSAETHTCDVTQQSEVKEVFERISKENPIDCLINNAGIAHVGNVLNTSEEDFDKVLSINVKGVYNCLQAGV